jgi:hypothetical protein
MYAEKPAGRPAPRQSLVRWTTDVLTKPQPKAPGYRMRSAKGSSGGVSFWARGKSYLRIW